VIYTLKHLRNNLNDLHNQNTTKKYSNFEVLCKLETININFNNITTKYNDFKYWYDKKN
jgi:hypothetical protein